MKRIVQLLVGVYMYVLKRRNKKMNIRMIGFDLDGTLLTTDKILTERTKKRIGGSGRSGSRSGAGNGASFMRTSERTFSASVHKYAVTS